ncbi:MAG: PQQ-binding-like beta-propeller repeat protein [Chloroflexi bacterium]|nr:PQQ-binding-like beta-propeller repeat protein [Chloroflexota bacterium]
MGRIRGSISTTLLISTLAVTACGQTGPSPRTDGLAGRTEAIASATPSSSAALASVVSGESPMYRGGPARTGEMPGPAVTSRPTILWSVATGAPAITSAAVKDGVAYFAGGDGILHALDVRTGSTVRNYAADTALQSAPAISGGLVAVTDQRHVLSVVDGTNGTLVWKSLPIVVVESMPLIIGEAVIVGGTDGLIHSFDLRTGAELWTQATSGVVTHALAAADGVVFAGSQDGSMRAFDVATGERRWSLPLRAEHFATPAVRDGVLYAMAAAPSGGQSALVAIDAAKGVELWRFVAPREGLYPPAVDAQAVYVGSSFGTMWALDRATGKPRWTAEPGGNLHAAPAIVDGIAYVSGDSQVVAIDTSNGTERWRLTLDGNVEYALTLVGGRIFAATAAGSLLALGAPDLLVASSPPPSATPSASSAPSAWIGTCSDAPGGLQTPAGMAMSPDGLVWLAEAGRDGFAIYDADCHFVERWGVPGAAAGQFNFHRALFPWGDVAFATDGSFYVADSANFRIQAFDKRRQLVRQWGTFGRGNGQFTDPVSVALDAAGDVLVVDDSRGDVQVFDRKGTYLRTIGEQGRDPGQLSNPGEIAVVGDRLYVADEGNDRIGVFATSGRFLSVLADGEFTQPQEVKPLDDGGFVIGIYGTRRIAVIDSQGATRLTFDTNDDWWPAGIVSLPAGRLLVAESGVDGPTEAGRISIYDLAAPAP